MEKRVDFSEYMGSLAPVVEPLDVPSASPPLIHLAQPQGQWCGKSVSDILYRNVPHFHALYYYYYLKYLTS